MFSNFKENVTNCSYVKNVLQGLVCYYFLISMDLNVISKLGRWLFATKILNYINKAQETNGILHSFDACAVQYKRG